MAELVLVTVFNTHIYVESSKKNVTNLRKHRITLCSLSTLSFCIW